MKKTILALSLFAASALASAQTFSVTPGAPVGPGNSVFNTSQFDAVNSVYTTKQSFLDFLALEGFSLSNAVTGTLQFTNGGDDVGSVTAEYFGTEAGFSNTLTLTGALNTLNNKTSQFDDLFGGDTISADAPVGISSVPALFTSSGGNGGNVLWILNEAGNAALGLYNDPFKGDKDYDDMVIRFTGVNGISQPPIPEPSAYAMLLAGLAAIFFVANRRKA
jgi:hypothetical protein